jgi:carbon storage regulator CsrA
MLVLSRKAKQQIQIGPDITITVLQVKGQCVRLGIEAPRDICVLRSELAEKMPHEGSSSTVEAARKKLARESAISSTPDNEDNGGRTMGSANGSLRCRAPRVDVAPLTSPYLSTGPASFLRPRRRRLALR